MVHYLASPYRAHPQGRHQAYRDAVDASARLLRGGAVVFSPVVYGHAIQETAGEVLDEAAWLGVDLAILAECDSLVVVMIPGWRESDGVADEIKRAVEREIPISYLSWPMLNVREDESGGYLPACG
jgi:hypothetical protein